MNIFSFRYHFSLHVWPIYLLKIWQNRLLMNIEIYSWWIYHCWSYYWWKNKIFWYHFQHHHNNFILHVWKLYFLNIWWKYYLETYYWWTYYWWKNLSYIILNFIFLSFHMPDKFIYQLMSIFYLWYNFSKMSRHVDSII